MSTASILERTDRCRCGKSKRPGHPQCWRCERNQREVAAFEAGRQRGYREGYLKGLAEALRTVRAAAGEPQR
jgi:hypothetical protein